MPCNDQRYAPQERELGVKKRPSRERGQKTRQTSMILLRLLKKLHMRGVEERGTRHTFLYAAVARDEDNNANGFF